MAVRMLEYCKEAYDPMVEVPLETKGLEFWNHQTDAEKITQITEEEIKQALTKCTSMAKGVDGYAQAQLRALGRELSPILLALFNNSLTTGSFPKQFLKNHNIFLHKKGDKEDPKNYCAIAIQNPILQVFSKIMHNR